MADGPCEVWFYHLERTPLEQALPHRHEPIEAVAESFNVTYLRLFDAFIRLYDGQYRIMGNAQVMTAKVAWDNACYWAITARLFFQRRLRRPEFIASIEPLMRRFFVLHARMQQMLRAWDLADTGVGYPATAANVVNVGWLRALQASLDEPVTDDDTLRATLSANFAQLAAGKALPSEQEAHERRGRDRLELRAAAVARVAVDARQASTLAPLSLPRAGEVAAHHGALRFEGEQRLFDCGRCHRRERRGELAGGDRAEQLQAAADQFAQCDVAVHLGAEHGGVALHGGVG